MSAYTPAGRCDRCGARAKAEVILPSGNNLLLCQHHLDKHETKLGELLAVVMPLSGHGIAV